jgi:hypothetical protein
MAADRGAFGVRISSEKKGNTCAIPDLAGATAPARPNVDPPLLDSPKKGEGGGSIMDE